jgi:hypothetical protein
MILVAPNSTPHAASMQIQRPIAHPICFHKVHQVINALPWDPRLIRFSYNASKTSFSPVEPRHPAFQVLRSRSGNQKVWNMARLSDILRHLSISVLMRGRFHSFNAFSFLSFSFCGLLLVQEQSFIQFCHINLKRAKFLIWRFQTNISSQEIDLQGLRRYLCPPTVHSHHHQQDAGERPRAEEFARHDT